MMTPTLSTALWPVATCATGHNRGTWGSARDYRPMRPARTTVELIRADCEDAPGPPIAE